MERALITGGAGFIGSHLCDFLLGEGYEVICLDNLITGSTDNIAHLLGKKYFIQKNVILSDPLHRIMTSLRFCSVLVSLIQILLTIAQKDG